MVSKSATPSSPLPRRSTHSPPPHRFKGVRMRSWGKWVSEIRLPNTRARLWLGSFSTAEQAARAFDVAVVCLRGRSATLNFPDSPPIYAPLGLPHHQIQELATAAAAASATTTTTTASTPVAPIPCEDVTIGPNCVESEKAITSSSSRSEESENPTFSYSSRSQESEDAIANEISSSGSSSNSRSASCTSSESATFADLLELEAESEQSSSLDAALQEHALMNMGGEWDELLWGLSTPSYTAPWDDQQLLLLPPFPAEDDWPINVEPSLWCL